MEVSATGGTSPYTFTLTSGTGSVGPTTGIYTAGDLGGTADITVTDSQGEISQVSVSVTGETPTAITLTAGSAWTVPSNWNSSDNSIEVIGAGGGGGGGGHWRDSSGQGGGGGGYSKATNVTLTPGAPLAYAIGGGGRGGGFMGNGATGGDTFVCGAGSPCSSLAGGGVLVGAQGGTGGPSGMASSGLYGNGTGAGTFINGGLAQSGVGTVTNSGGRGNVQWNPSYGTKSMGSGGGAAGPNGNGADGSVLSGGAGDAGAGGAGGTVVFGQAGANGASRTGNPRGRRRRSLWRWRTGREWRRIWWRRRRREAETQAPAEEAALKA